MVDASQIYDTIHLDVTAGGGFEAAQAKIQDLIGQLGKLGGTTTPINIDTSQIDAAIEKLRNLSAGVAPPTPGIRQHPGGASPIITRRKYDEINRTREAEMRRFTEWDKGGRYGAYMKEAHLAALRKGARLEMEGEGVPYKTGFKDIGTAAPAATENLNKVNESMAKTVDTATNLGKTMPLIPPAISNVTNSLKAAVPAAEAAAIKLDAVKLTGQNMKPALAEAAIAQKNLKNAMLGAAGQMPKNSAEMKKANAALTNLNGKMAEAKGQTNAYTLSWKNMTAVMGKVAFWMIATGAIYGTIRAFKNALDIIIKVDHAMADIRKVYQGAPSDIKPLRNDLIELNVALGGNVEQSMEAAVGWARLGYKRREITALMRTSMLAMNIAELSAADATQLLTAAMQQFKMPATGAITVLDSWNELSNRTLATTRDLGDSVSIAGATFQQTGDSIHYLNAITATLVQTMAKSGREVGTAMRTLGTFMYRPKTIKTVKEITGVEIEKAPTPKKLPGEDQAEYTRRMRDNMKSQSEVLGEVAAKWDTLTEKQQINLAQSMAGVRRYNYFVALMGNYDMVMDNLLLSINSVGSAERENAIYMDTLQKQIERLKSSFTKLYVAAGDGGLAGVLKGIVKVLTFLVDGFAGVNFTVPLITIAILALANGFKKLIAVGGGFRNILKSFASPMGQLNAGILALGAAFAILESAAASAQKRISNLKAETDKWIQSLDGAAEGIKNVADNAETLTQYKQYIELKFKPGSPEYIAAMDKYTRAVEEQSEQLMLNKGITYEAAKALVESGEVTGVYTDTLDKNNDTLRASRDEHLEMLSILQAFNTETPEAEENMRAYALASTLTAHEGMDVWREFGQMWSQIKEQGPIEVFKDSDTLTVSRVAEATGLVQAKVESLNEALGAGTQRRMDALGDEIDELSDSAGGAGTKIDRLQQMMELFAERLRGINRDTALVNHLMEFNNNILDEMENKYGAVAYATDGYLTTLNEQNNYLEDTIALTEASIIKDQEHLAMLTAARDMLISSGSAVKDYKDDIDSLTETLHQDERALQALQSQLVQTNNRGFAAFVDLMEKQRGFGRAPDVLSRVLPSRADAVEVGREIGYIMDDLEEIGKTTDKDIIGAMSRWGIYSNSIYISYDQINNMLLEINATQEEREAIEQRLGELQNINIAAAQKLNQEYERLANTFQNIVDEGLFGIIMGEQTALDLAKELGREWAGIALKTVTQPATEAFGAGMGGAAYFMKHGKLPQGMGGGIADVKLKDGRVPVYDEALASAVGAMAAGQGVGGAGLSMGLGGQGAGRGPGGAGALGTIMPIAGGMLTGGLMGSGGGAGGAMFGSMMGGIGAAVSLVPGWGQIAGAGISLLGLLGNLFGGKKHEEEDPYANQQAAGMGERSVSIGSAGTVNNYVYFTVYYESSTDQENVSQLYDALEEEGLARGYQVTGNAAPSTV